MKFRCEFMLKLFLQYRNPGNPLAHYDTTAEEIITQCGGKVRQANSEGHANMHSYILLQKFKTYIVA